MKKPRYYRVIQGTSIAPIVDNNTYEGEKQFITGNVLTGERIKSDGYLGFYDFQISVITEGNYSEFLVGYCLVSISIVYLEPFSPG